MKTFTPHVINVLIAIQRYPTNDSIGNDEFIGELSCYQPIVMVGLIDANR
jgi:hypothetical protein